MRLAPFCRRKEIGDRHVAAGHDGASADALHGAVNHDLSHRFAEAQKERADGENRQAEQQEQPTPIDVAQPANDRERECDCNQVRGCSPGVAVETAQVSDDEGHRRGDHGLAQRAQKHGQQHAGHRCPGLPLRRRREAALVLETVVVRGAVFGIDVRVRTDALPPAAPFHPGHCQLKSLAVAGRDEAHLAGREATLSSRDMAVVKTRPAGSGDRSTVRQ